MKVFLDDFISVHETKKKLQLKFLVNFVFDLKFKMV